MEYAKDGHAFFRVLTPQVAREYELPVTDLLTDENLKRYEELQDLAELHRTSITTSSYRTL